VITGWLSPEDCPDCDPDNPDDQNGIVPQEAE
jgi:hypothetical protein